MQSGVAAGTRIRFHVDAPLSSATSKTGETFAFTLVDPVHTTGARVIPAGTKGSGTVLVAGHAGSQGHEGDLTLRLDTLALADGGTLSFDNQKFEVNGRNRKAASGILGFIPLVGYGAMFIRGNDVRIDPGTPVETVLDRGALISRRPERSSVVQRDRSRAAQTVAHRGNEVRGHQARAQLSRERGSDGAARTRRRPRGRSRRRSPGAARSP